MDTIKKPLALAVALCALSASGSAFAYEAGDLIVRFGLTNVAPQDDSSLVALNGDTSVPGVLGGNSTLAVDSNTQLGFTAEYMLNSNWGIELLAATPFSHTVSAEGTLSGAINEVVDLKHLPPTLSAVYHFETAGPLDPYVGLGLNYTLFFDDGLTSEAEGVLATLGLTGGEVDLDNSFGFSLQVGADYQINKEWLLNASVRWIDIDTDATITFDNGAAITSSVEVDPLVYSLTLGYKF